MTQLNSVIIWMHGLGADANDMRGLAEAIPVFYSLSHIFLEAPIRPVRLLQNMPVRAWYDLSPIMPQPSQDWPQTSESEQMIQQAIQQQINQGVSAEKIFLAGFSQGAAMALLTGLRSTYRLGGIIALSGYLPWPEKCTHRHTELPIFFGIGLQDDRIKPEWTQLSIDCLLSNQYKNLSIQHYNMGHSVCTEEIKDISTWLSGVLNP